MDDSSTLRALRVWLDELADSEEQFAWLRDATLEPGEPDKQASPPPEVLLLGRTGAVDAEELGNRVDSEPTLGGHFDHAVFKPVSDAGTVGVFVVRLL